ncbi:hypothetical protein ACLOJK_032768 [Asimina triloba]
MNGLLEYLGETRNQERRRSHMSDELQIRTLLLDGNSDEAKENKENPALFYWTRKSLPQTKEPIFFSPSKRGHESGRREEERGRSRTEARLATKDRARGRRTARQGWRGPAARDWIWI